jgi:hypothetical protein
MTEGYKGVPGATPPPAGGSSTTKTPIGVNADYKAVRSNTYEYDAVGRRIIPDNMPVGDPAKEVHASDATREITSTSAHKSGTKTVDDGLNVSEGQLIGKSGRIVGQSYWIDGHRVERQTIKGKKGEPDTYKYYWADGSSTHREGDLVDQSKYQKKKQVDDYAWETTKSKGDARTEVKNDEIAPRYFEGNQYAPATQPPEKIAELQRKLIKAGVLAQGFTSFGIWDDVSSAAYEKILGYANQQGLSDDEIMESWTKYGAANGDPDKKLVVKNPEEVAATVKEAAAKILGRSLSQAEVDQLVAGYQSLDRQQQESQAATAAQISDTAYTNFTQGKPTTSGGGTQTSTEPISVETYATNKVRTDHKGESQFMTGVDRMNSFYSMLGEAV